MTITTGNNIVRHLWLLVFFVFPVIQASAQLDKQTEQRYIQVGLKYIEIEKYDSAIIQFNQLFHPDATADQRKRGQSYINLCKCLKAEQERDYNQSLAFLQQATDVDWSLIHINGVSSPADLRRRLFNKGIQQLKTVETIPAAGSTDDSVLLQKETPSSPSVYQSIVSSVLLPGLGQLEKGHTIEGIATLTGEVILVGGAITTYYLGKNQMDGIKDGITDYDQYVAACKTYDNLQTTNQVLWIASAVLYVFNIVRSATLQPLNHEVVVQSSVMNTGFQPIPTIGLTYRF